MVSESPHNNSAPPSQTAADKATPSWTLKEKNGDMCLCLYGSWTMTAGRTNPVFPPDSLAKTRHSKGETLHIEAEALSDWDSNLIAFLWDVKQAAGRASFSFDDHLLPAPAQRLLALLPTNPGQPSIHHQEKEPVLARIGHNALEGLDETGTLSILAKDVACNAVQAVRGKSAMRLRDLFQDIWNAGPSALLIVSIVNFLVGAILAFVGLIELRKFAAEIYITNLVGIACAREISAIMTAIIMAGRTGGAYAARISTMLGNEEIDALQVSGIPVSGYILLPSVLSLTIMMPLLYLYGTLVAMLGGFVVSMSMMDISPTGYWLSTLNGVELKEFIFGFIKSIFFAVFIALAACRVGLKAGRSAADVGIAATRAVVIGIVGTIALDAIFAVIANALGV